MSKHTVTFCFTDWTAIMWEKSDRGQNTNCKIAMMRSQATAEELHLWPGHIETDDKAVSTNHSKLKQIKVHDRMTLIL